MMNKFRIAPQKDWPSNEPQRLTRVLSILEPIAKEFGASLADGIVISGNFGLEATIKAAGHTSITVPFTPGRGNATQEITALVGG